MFSSGRQIFEKKMLRNLELKMERKWKMVKNFEYLSVFFLYVDQLKYIF